MSSAGLPEANRAFTTLRRFVRRDPAAERCEMCSAGLATDHQHLINLESRKLVCACDACAILFSGQDGTRYKRVPRRARFLAGFQMTDAQWDSLMVPISMAFFFRSSRDGRVVALYPSPAGATESLLALDAWNDIVEENPALRDLEDDVEALLVNRLGHVRGFSDPEYYLVPIDECYKLVGLIRAQWRGLSGGTEVWEDIRRFFAALQEKC